MCGGKGTRMWPISNMSHPKQFEGLLGNKSMFRETIERVLKGFSAQDIFIATSRDFAQFLKDQAPEVPEPNFILEPAMRDNLGAIGLATAVINHRHPGSVIIILWGADHIVQKEAEFITALKCAAQLAQANDVIIHVDTPPTYPSVHNGWIKIGQEIQKIDSRPVYEFVNQIEKPNQAKANELFKDPTYLIHVGYMATKPELLLKYYQQYAPEAYKIIHKIQIHLGTPEYDQILEQEYPKFEKVSVDYGLFEKLPPKSQWELPTDMGWIDVGTWELLYNGLPKDEAGNVLIGESVLINTHNSLIISQSKQPVGIVGMDNVIIVSSDTGLLVCSLKEAPQVKQLYELINSGQKNN